MAETTSQTPTKNVAAEKNEVKPKQSVWAAIRNMPVVGRVVKLPRQICGINPFGGEILPTRVPVFTLKRGRPSLPFPTRWNYDTPLKILAAYYWNTEHLSGGAKDNRYFEVWGRSPILVTRDPRVIRAISAQTGAGEGQFDRDTAPSSGIARATGKDSLLYANGEQWKRQKKLSTPPFSRSNLFQPEQFRCFAETFRHTVRERMERLQKKIEAADGPVRVALEPEIKNVILELLVNNFFGAAVSYEEISAKYVPAVECVIDHIVRDTVANKLGIPLRWRPGWSKRTARVKEASAIFEELTNVSLAGRKKGRGLWDQFKSDAPDDALRANIRSFLAGALEATTSYASWALSHLARDPAAQEKLHAEVKGVEDFVPETLGKATYLDQVLNETLRLTPALYFHPRRAKVDTLVEVGTGETMWVPKGTHILLDIWHANRHEGHWGVEATGFAAADFVPERWAASAKHDLRASDLLHFGFGHGPRFCPGKSLGQLETALVVGACVKLFKITAVNQENPARAGVSTKPADGVLVEISRREAVAGDTGAKSDAPKVSSGKCPFTGHGA